MKLHPQILPRKQEDGNGEMRKDESSIWQDGCRCAISLTFDDGLTSQLEIAMPLLNKYGLCGTFYLNPKGDAWKSRYAPWIEPAQSGHEIGNHSLSHLCSCNFSHTPDCRGLENVTLEEIETDILEAQRRLEALVPRQKAWTFAYPCYQDFVGRGDTRQSYVPLVARHFTAARGVGELLTANSVLACDLHYLWSWPVQRMSGAEMVGLVEKAVTQGRWGILTFHGINEGHLPISSFDLEELLAFLYHNRDRIWTAPIVEVAKRVIKWRNTTK